MSTLSRLAQPNDDAPDTSITCFPEKRGVSDSDKLGESIANHKGPKVWNTGTLTDKFRVNRRRMAQGFLQTFGRTEPSDDSRYKAYHDRFLDVVTHLKSVVAHLQEYRNVMGSFCRVCSQLGSEVLNMVDPERIGNGSDAELFSRAMSAVDSRKEMKQGYHTPDDAIAAAIHSLNKKLTEMDTHKKKMRTREKLKLDFDGYERKLRALRSAKKIDESKIRNKEEKMREAREALEKATDDIYKIFAYYEARRETIISQEMELFRQTQESFFSRGLQAMSFQLKHTDTTHDTFVECAHEIFKQMKSPIHPKLLSPTKTSSSPPSCESGPCNDIAPPLLQPPQPKCAPPRTFRGMNSLDRRTSNGALTSPEPRIRSVSEASDVSSNDNHSVEIEASALRSPEQASPLSPEDQGDPPIFFQPPALKCAPPRSLRSVITQERKGSAERKHPVKFQSDTAPDCTEQQPPPPALLPPSSE